MLNPTIIFGEPIETHFFEELMMDKDSKYLTEFKRYFNYLKKNHDSYKDRPNLKDIISIDKPLIDYINIIKDWVEVESNNKYTLYSTQYNTLFFGFKINNPIDVDSINRLCKEWKRSKDFRQNYYDWISKFTQYSSDENEGPLLLALI